MPEHPTLDQRVDWHLAHAIACGCREMPDTIKREIEKRGLAVPERNRPN
ncbi:hypothetical protein ACI3KW_20350 [Devosia sp. ZW T5_3]